MKILYLTKYSRNAGSSRLRSFQYFPFLEAQGWQVTVQPLFSERYLTLLYAGKSTALEAAKGYINRLLVLCAVKRYDRLVIEKELFPFMPAWAEKILNRLRISYFVDYDDAIFHNYDQHPIFKKFLPHKIDQVMKNSAAVVAGNRYLADRARKAGASTVHIVPTVIDLCRYPVKTHGQADHFVLGWIGTKSTFEKHLLPCRHWLKEAQRLHPQLHVHIIGVTEEMDLGPRVSYIPWTEESEVAEILKMDAGLMPLQDSVWEKGKCAYKLIQYAACGIPGIASDVGMNREVTVPRETGILANTDAEWLGAVGLLIHDPSERLRLGTNARKKVERVYSIQQTHKMWLDILSHGR